MVLSFPNVEAGEYWYTELLARQQAGANPLPPEQYVPEGIALLRRTPNVPHEIVGQVECTDQNFWRAERGLQLRAGTWGADAIFGVKDVRSRDPGPSACHVSGLAVRVEDATAREQLRFRWYGENISILCQQILLLLVIQGAVLFLTALFCSSTSNLGVGVGETLSETLMSMGLGLAIFSGWPLFLVLLLRVLRWPGLLRAVGIAVLVATTGRGLTVWAAHILAGWSQYGNHTASELWVVADPIIWVFILFGMVLCRQAWRHARDARKILPWEMQTVSTARKVWSRGLLAATCVYAVVLLGWLGMSRYEHSVYWLQPGVDTEGEHKALLAFNEGLIHAKKEDWAAANTSWERSLRLWEKLTEGRSSPANYRRNLAITLYNLGWLRERQGRHDEAIPYYDRAVALDEKLKDPRDRDDEFNKVMVDAHQAQDEMRARKNAQLLDEKEKAGIRKFKEAEVKAVNGDVAAENLFREGIALWEEVQARRKDEEYQLFASKRLAWAYLLLGEFQLDLAKHNEAKAALTRAIEYGEKAVFREPESPNARRYLEQARQRVDEIADAAQEKELDALLNAQRYADAIALCSRRVKEQEEQLRAGKDREAGEGRLAYRVDRFAWLLAHCPDGRGRDLKEALKNAHQATVLRPNFGNYWYTLALVQYRTGAWQDSIDSLDHVKARESGFDGSCWFLLAMNRQQLKQKAEARAALAKAEDWLKEQERQAKDNALLQSRLEMTRPILDQLRREAFNLIEGRNPAAR